MQNTRPVVPRNVERQLWSESCGFCMNPECSKQLISESAGQNIGQMAHIVPHAQSGNVSVDNLILLCANCHLGTEPLRTQNGEARLRSWKAQAKQRIEQQFSECFSSFELLEDAGEVRIPFQRRAGRRLDHGRKRRTIRASLFRRIFLYLPSVRMRQWRATVATASDLSSPSPGNRSPGFEGAGWLMAIEG